MVDREEGDEEAGRVVESLNLRREVVRQASNKLSAQPHRAPPPGPSRVDSHEGMAIERIVGSQRRIARIRAAQEKRLVRTRARTVEAEPPSEEVGR